MNKVTRIVVILLSSIAILIVLITVIGFWPGSTKNIESIANRFQPDPSWTLESETINPPRIICLQADCGQIRKVWEIPKVITNRQEILSITKDMNAVFKFSDDCLEGLSTGTIGVSCRASSSIDNHATYIEYIHSSDQKPRIILHIERDYDK